MGIRLEIDFASRQAKGSREEQEDFCAFSYLDEQNGILGVLADGMGGYAAGEHASSVVANSFAQNFFNSSGTNRARLEQSLVKANEALKNEIQRDFDKYSGMGTTFVGVIINQSGIEWVSVGDSPLFHWNRKRGVKRLNDDHSMAPEINEMLKSETLTDQERQELSKKRSNLKSAIVGGEIELVDYSTNPYLFQENDILVVASDGLLSIDERKISDQIEINQRNAASDIADSLVTTVLGKRVRNQDNTSVGVVKLGALLNNGNSTE